MQNKYGFFWLAKIFGCEPNGSANKIPSASLVSNPITLFLYAADIISLCTRRSGVL